MQNYEISIALGHLAYHLRYLYLSTAYGGYDDFIYNSNPIMINEEQALAMDSISVSLSKLHRK